MFEPLWNRNFIDYVEITGAEFLGVEERGGYYDNSGAVRDMFQNHLLQVLAMVGMEPPAQINADSMRDEVVKVLQCLKPLDETALRNDLVLGQYTASDVRGQHLPGYREENGVADDSRTETYIGLKLTSTTGVGMVYLSMYVQVSVFRLALLKWLFTLNKHRTQCLAKMRQKTN